MFTFNKSVALLVLMLAATSASAQNQYVAFRNHTFSAAGADITINMTHGAVSYEKITWFKTGTVSACQVKLQQSADGLAWSDLIAVQTCTSTGTSSVAHVVANFVRINVTSFTGTGAVAVTFTGYIDDPSVGGGVVSVFGRGGVVTAQANDYNFNQLAGSVNLATQVTGNLGVTHLAGGVNADATHFWRGDGAWAVPAGGGGGSPGAPDTSVQTNQGGVFVGDAAFTFNATTKAVGGLGGVYFNPTALATPGTPTVTPTNGTASTWGYRIVARFGNLTTDGGTEGTTAAGAATLNVTDFNTVTWSAVTGATSYDVYRTTVATSPTTTGLLGNTALLTFKDDGVAGDSGYSLDYNETGAVGVANRLWIGPPESGLSFLQEFVTPAQLMLVNKNTGDTSVIGVEGETNGTALTGVNVSMHGFAGGVLAGATLDVTSGSTNPGTTARGVLSLGLVTGVATEQIAIGVDAAASIVNDLGNEGVTTVTAHGVIAFVSADYVIDYRAEPISIDGTSVLVAAYGMDIGLIGQSSSGTPTLTSSYGLHISDQTSSVAANKWAIKVDGGKSEFDGQLGLGADPGASIMLDVQGGAAMSATAYSPVGGAGLNDATFQGTPTQFANFFVAIDSTGTPDTFTWAKDFQTVASNVPITGAAQALSDGVTVTFAATTGHTNGNQWSAQATTGGYTRTKGGLGIGAIPANGVDLDVTTSAPYGGVARVGSLTASKCVGTDASKNLVSDTNCQTLPDLVGTTGSIGGGLLTIGTCTSGTASVTGATTAMSATASPVTYPGDGNYWLAYVSGADVVTVKVCAVATLTPTASAYNVRVLQ